MFIALKEAWNNWRAKHVASDQWMKAQGFHRSTPEEVARYRHLHDCAEVEIERAAAASRTTKTRQVKPKSDAKS